MLRLAKNASKLKPKLQKSLVDITNFSVFNLFLPFQVKSVPKLCKALISCVQFNHSNWLSKEPVQLEGMHKHMECINIVGRGFLIPYFIEIPRLYIAFRPLFPMFPPFSFMCSQQLWWCSGYHYCTTSFN